MKMRRRWVDAGVTRAMTRASPNRRVGAGVGARVTRGYGTRITVKMDSTQTGQVHACMNSIRTTRDSIESTACMQNFSPAARERDVQRIELTQFTMPIHHTERFTGNWTS